MTQTIEAGMESLGGPRIPLVPGAGTLGVEVVSAGKGCPHLILSAGGSADDFASVDDRETIAPLRASSDEFHHESPASTRVDRPKGFGRGRSSVMSALRCDKVKTRDVR